MAIRELFRGGTVELWTLGTPRSKTSKTDKRTKLPPPPTFSLQSPPKKTWISTEKKRKSNETQVCNEKSINKPISPSNQKKPGAILTPACRFCPRFAPRNKPPQMVPRDLNIAFQLLAALIQVLQLSFHLRPKQNNSKPVGRACCCAHLVVCCNGEMLMWIPWYAWLRRWVPHVPWRWVDGIPSEYTPEN